MIDNGAGSGSAYLYKVCAADGSGNCTSGYSNIVLGARFNFPTDSTITTIADDPSGLNVSTMKLEHIMELRTAVNAVRSLAGLSAASWAQPTLTRYVSVISKDDVQELRTKLDEALTALGIQTSAYDDTTLAGAPNGTLIKGVHIRQLRQRATSGLGGSGGGGGTSVTIQWLVTDHLGTPRMIIDKTGELANVKRHDYLPFGEELFAGTGNRSIALGYSGDTIRQKFTLKERDNETGLDYFFARYYSSTQGRFTSVDPLMASARTANPQTFNRYSYTLNNPLRYVDPTGLEGQDPADYRPEFRPCTVGVEAGCSEANTVLAGVTINISPPAVPLEAPSMSLIENLTLGTGQVASDTVIGAGKFGYNTFVGTSNMVNAPIDYGLSFFTNFQFGQGELYQASTPGEQGAMYGMMIGGILAGGFGSAGAATEGALSSNVANTFASGYRIRTLQMDVTAYRYSGGESGAFGRFLTTRQTIGQIGSPTEAQSFLNLPSGNTAQTLNVFTIPRGTTIFHWTGRWRRCPRHSNIYS